jgi:hypothetical protein
MAKKVPSKRKMQPARKARVHKSLNGLEVSIGSFGEIQSTMNIEKINSFLDENVDDKKLIEQKEHDQKKKESKKK